MTKYFFPQLHGRYIPSIRIANFRSIFTAPGNSTYVTDMFPKNFTSHGCKSSWKLIICTLRKWFASRKGYFIKLLQKKLSIVSNGGIHYKSIYNFSILLDKKCWYLRCLELFHVTYSFFLKVLQVDIIVFI